MIPTRADVDKLVRFHLGDTASSAQIYTSAFNSIFLNAAYMELFGWLDKAETDRIKRTQYYLLPANTSVLSPATAGWSNFNSPIEIRERGNVTAYAISAVIPSSPSAGLATVTVASLPSNIITGSQVDINGVLGVSEDINDNWTLTVNSPTSIVLNGCTASGTYTSGGFVYVSAEDWSSPLVAYDDYDHFPSTPQSSLGEYSWNRNLLRFPPCSSSREIRVEYELSGSLPIASINDADSMGVEDSLNFLAARTAQLSGSAKGASPAKVQELMAMANSYLDLFVFNLIKDKQVLEPIIPGRFRLPRNIHQQIW